MSYPFKAKTNKKTILIRLWSESIPLAKGKLLTVYYEDGPLGTVSTTVHGEEVFGSVPRADYSK